VVFSEESRHPRRTVPVATYLSVVIIGVLYATAAWAMTVATGPDAIVSAAREQGTDLVFNLAASQLGGFFAEVGHVLFVTSLVAAMISFHNTSARYAFALGRERVLPAAFGRTSRRSGAPKVGSLAQSAVGFAVIVLYAVAGWDPLVQLFFWAGTGGGFGVLLLITATSVAVLRFFARHRAAANPWRGVVAPALASLALLAVLALALTHFATLLGVPPDAPLRWLIPAGYLLAALLGAVWAVTLRITRPDVYAAIGLGAKSATVVPVARPREVTV
jgi:amino acid transporter